MNWRRKLLPRKPVAPAPTVPWAMSQKPDPATAVPNEPTPEGRKVGAMLGALADAAEAEQRRDFPNMLPRCNDCAFRAGTLPNGCEETLMDAMKCAVEGKPFYCHKGLKEGEAPKRLCSGVMVLYTGPQHDELVRVIAEATRDR